MSLRRVLGILLVVVSMLRLVGNILGTFVSTGLCFLWLWRMAPLLSHGVGRTAMPFVVSRLGRTVC